MPKFAFFNSIVAHNYSTQYENLATVAQSFDAYLASFLESMVAAHGHDTVIVLRGDHGLQGGPSVLDYSVQQEHRRPWVNIIVPRKFTGVGGFFDENEGRLMTGYDLHKTLLSFITGGVGGSGSERDVSQLTAPWAYNLITEAIPRNRSCKDAMIPLDFCSW